MNMKVCSKCKVKKSLENFVKRRDSLDGYRGTCKLCYNEYKREIRNNNTELQKEKNKEDRQNYRKLNYNKLIENERNYQKNNKEKEFIRKKKYKEENREKYLDSIRNYKKRNKEKIKEKSKIYYQKNKNKIRIYENERRKTDNVYRLTCSMRSRINLFIKSKKINKTNKTFNLIGLKPMKLKEYIEKKFTEEMCWDNYGLFGWHIDHIIPLASAKSEDEIYKLCHYTNLQPLWAEDNLKKSNKILKEI